MAKSNQRMNEEIKVIAKIWNSRDDRNPDSRANEICSAIYWTLQWARGHRCASPSEQLLRRLKEARNLAA